VAVLLKGKLTELHRQPERIAELKLGVRAVARLAVVLAVASLPAILDRGAVAQAATLYTLAESAHPYWVPSHAFLLYVRAPAAAISACAMFLAPGLFLALAAGMASTMAIWVLAGFMLSIVVVSVFAAAVQSTVSVPLVDGPFAATVLGLSATCLLVLLFAVYRGRPVVRPWAHIHSRTMTAVIVGLPVLMLTALAPKFYWDSFNGDGAHTFEAARLLLRQPVPFFGPAAGEVSSFPGFTTMLFLYPASWFIRLFGNIEAAVRIPFVLNLAALFCAIVAVAEKGRGALSRGAYWLIALSLTLYAVTMTFSGTYSPYSADITLPATQDTLLLALFLAYVFFFIEGRSWWMTLAIVLTYLTLPSGLILIVLWLVAVILRRPRPLPLVFRSLIVIAGCMLAGSMLARLLPALGLPGPGGEHGLANLLRAFAFLQFTDWHRFLYVIVPAGVIPALALFAWKRLDPVGQSLALVALGYFGLFFIQGHISLHYFVPPMILPIVVFWRWADGVNDRYRRPLLGAVAAGAFTALILSLPRDARPEAVSRRVGFAVEDRTDGYERSDPRSFRRSELFANLFPRGWEASVPERSFGGSPLVWLYYAHHAPSSARPSNYVLQPLAAPAPVEMRLVASDRDAALYVRSDSVWRGHVALRPATPAGSPIYEVPRGVLFRSVPPGAGQRIFSVVNALASIGVDTAFILNRLGVKR
jgi:hypothetical protein